MSRNSMYRNHVAARMLSMWYRPQAQTATWWRTPESLCPVLASFVSITAAVRIFHASRLMQNIKNGNFRRILTETTGGEKMTWTNAYKCLMFTLIRKWPKADLINDHNNHKFIINHLFAQCRHEVIQYKNITLAGQQGTTSTLLTLVFRNFPEN